LPTREGASRDGIGRGLALCLLFLLPALTASSPLAAATPVPVMALAPSELVVTRPGLVLVDPPVRRATLGVLLEEQRAALCGGPRNNWPTHGVQRNISGDAQVAQTLARTMMEAAARYLAEAEAGARDAILSNLARLAAEDAFSRLVEPITVNHFYNLDRTLLPTITAFALLVSDPEVEPSAIEPIRTWLDRLVRWRGPEREVDPTRPSSRNNHRYLRDSVTMAWGAAIGDHGLFYTGIDRFRIALSQMRDDGSLPLETERGSQALFYQRHAISSLVAIAEMAAVQGYDLYAMQNEAGHDLHHMIRFLVEGIDDPAVVAPYTDEEQYLGFLARRGHDRHYMAWFEAYRARFPDSELTQHLEVQIASLGTLDEAMLDEYAGGPMTCFFADPTVIDRVGSDVVPASLPEESDLPTSG
jgi:poly(beta-D-mannuronate) lyase